MIEQSQADEPGDDPWRNEMKDLITEGDPMSRYRRVNRWLICTLMLLAFAGGYLSAVYQQPAVAFVGPAGPSVGPRWQYMSDGTNHIMRIDLSVADPIPERFTYCTPNSTDIDVCWQESSVYNKK